MDESNSSNDNLNHGKSDLPEGEIDRGETLAPSPVTPDLENTSDEFIEQVFEKKEIPIEEVKAAIEAMLFISGGAVPKAKIYRAFEDASIKISRKAIDGQIRELMDDYHHQQGGIIMEEVAGGFRLATAPKVSYILSKFQDERRRQRLSSAAVETLAIISYKQPITRGQIENIRGVGAGNIVRNLIDLELVQVLGRDKEARGAYLYGTTDKFLEMFGLQTLEDLPQLEQ